MGDWLTTQGRHDEAATLGPAKERALDRIHEIIATGRTKDKDGNEIRASSTCSLAQAEHFVRLIETDENIRATLEIGCAHGVSTLAITGALSEREEARHTMIDPHQSSYWGGAGLASLRACGLTNWELIEDCSEFALPRLCAEGCKYDLIFIDGWHTLDHALIDAFYATRMLKVGGYLLLDDTEMPGLWKLARYLRNYPCYELHSEVPATAVPRPLRGDFWRDRAGMVHGRLGRLVDMPRMVVFRKRAEDARPWDWFEPF
jgi:predicted O-methyltransferase YrrM